MVIDVDRGTAPAELELADVHLEDAPVLGAQLHGPASERVQVVPEASGEVLLDHLELGAVTAPAREPLSRGVRLKTNCSKS